MLSRHCQRKNIFNFVDAYNTWWYICVNIQWDIFTYAYETRRERAWTGGVYCSRSAIFAAPECTLLYDTKWFSQTATDMSCDFLEEAVE